ncbi:MAG: M48 family metalloprotease, partial [Candidatus Heimdallarchaeota archaeon]|nr:M48 family metalloprotease [Candidatus Heimdallarchaeota archaeon]
SFSDRENNVNPIALLITWIVAPMAAIMIQMAISRSREFAADHEAAKITGNPVGLANALRKLDSYSKYSPKRGQPSPSLSHLYIANPLSSKGFAGMFSTHPPVADRISRLEQMSY